MSDKVDTYSVECNCGTCQTLRDSMAPSCGGCRYRHNEVVTLTANNEALKEKMEELEEQYDHLEDQYNQLHPERDRYYTALEEIRRNEGRCEHWPAGIKHDVPCRYLSEGYDGESLCSWCIATTAIKPPCGTCEGRGKVPKYHICPLCDGEIVTCKWTEKPEWVNGGWWTYGCKDCEESFAEEDNSILIPCPSCQGGE